MWGDDSDRSNEAGRRDTRARRADHGHKNEVGKCKIALTTKARPLGRPFFYFPARAVFVNKLKSTPEDAEFLSK